MPTPTIIPVIDIMGGQVVRAIGGRRSEYRPVQSVLTGSTEPGEVARVLVAATQADCVYVADLDGIMHHRQDHASVRAVAAAGATVLLDAGGLSPDEPDYDIGVGIRFVIATETWTPQELHRYPLKYCLFSIDLFGGRVVGSGAWGDDPVEVFRRAVRLGAWEILFLDLARVGTSTGTGTEEVIATCKRSHPNVCIAAGGGVRTWEDVDRLGDAGASAVLVASALHDGTLTLPRPTA